MCDGPAYLVYVLAGLCPVCDGPAYLVYVLAGLCPAYLVCGGWHVACLLSICVGWLVPVCGGWHVACLLGVWWLACGLLT